MTKVVNDTTIAETLAEARAIARRPQVWMVLLGAGFVIGLTGPFGTYTGLSAPMRIAYWLVVVVTTFWIGSLVSFAATSWAESAGLAAPWSIAVGAVVASLPVTAWLALLHMVIFAASFWNDALRLLPYVTVIVLGIAALYEALEAGDSAIATAAAPPAEPGWLDGLPAHLGRDLILLQSQDHYVRAETSRGNTLIRTTIQDAAEALGAHGMRVHRSWWVARAAVAAYRYRGGAPVIVLRTGQEVPVGRTYRRAVKEALRA